VISAFTNVLVDQILERQHDGERDMGDEPRNPDSGASTEQRDEQ
jgi:hypothetical protein